MPCRLATAATGSRSASRMIATICSSVNRPFRIAPSESGASLSTNRWPENPGAGQDLAIRDLTTAISLQVGGQVFLANISQFRALYPEYATATDEAIARKLQQTFFP